MAQSIIPRFLHKYRLRFGTPINLSKELSTTSGFTSPLDLDKSVQNSKNKPNAYELTTHQISFRITKDSNKEPNKSEITIYNLDDDLVNYLSNNTENTLAVILEAGYQDEIKTIFKGTISKISDTFQKTDRLTKLMCSDGGINVGEAVTSRSYPAGTPVKNVINDLASDLGTPVGNISIDTTLSTFSAPVAFMGSTATQLANLTNSIDHNFSIQDGAIYVTPSTKRLSAESAYLTEDTGLKSAPSPLSQGETKSKSHKSKKPKDGIGFSCQLDGAIIPESTVYVKSRTYDGAFKVTKVVHSGSYEEDDWTTKVEAVKIDAVISSQ